METVTVSIDANGGQAVLSNGMAVVVPPGTVTSPVTLKLDRIEGDSLYAASHQTVLDLSVTGSLPSGGLKIPMMPGQDTSLVGAVRKDGNNHVSYLTGSYSSALDTFYVDLSAGKSVKASDSKIVSSGTYVVSRGTSHPPISVGQLLELPYHRQEGDNCWAAAMLLFMKSHKTSLAWENIHELLHEAGVAKTDGYGWYSMGNMKYQCEYMTGLKAEKNTWIKFGNFVAHVFKCLDANKPVMVNLITHQGVICGYEIENPGPSETTYFYLHDPANFGVQTPYRKMSLNDMVTTYWNQGIVKDLVNYFVTINYTTPMLLSPDLVTIQLPDADTLSNSASGFAKGLAFVEGVRVVDRVKWDHQYDDGYRFEGDGSVPADVEQISLVASPVFNTDRDGATSVAVKTRLHRVVNGVYKWPPLAEVIDSRSVPANSSIRHSAEFDVTDFVEDLTAADTLFAVQAELYDASNRRVCGFEVEFEFHPLRIVNLQPDHAEQGDQVTISGLGFEQSPGEAVVEFNGVEADVVSWANDRLVVTVPPGATTGDVVVKRGDVESNAMRFTVEGNVIELLQTTNTMMVSFHGLHTFGPGGDQYPWSIVDEWEDVQWTGTSFTANTTWYTHTYTVTGTVTASGDTLKTLDAYHYDSNELLQEVYHIILKDIPLSASPVSGDTVLYDRTVSSGDHTSHVVQMTYRKWNEESVWDEYWSTDWNSSSTPPRVRIWFGAN